jgi:hypothetical protein
LGVHRGNQASASVVVDAGDSLAGVSHGLGHQVPVLFHRDHADDAREDAVWPLWQCPAILLAYAGFLALQRFERATQWNVITLGLAGRGGKRC